MNKTEPDRLLRTLQGRFEQHPARHAGVAWAQVRARLDAAPAALTALAAMEASGGEPDVIGVDTGSAAGSGELLFCNCATGMALAMGVELLSEAQ
jgi:Protein of unknown function (DUF4256)